MFTVELYDHAFVPVRHTVDLRVNRYRWAAAGGPESCELFGACAEDDADDALNWLRYWVVVRNTDGDEVWWGYVESVETTRGETSVGRSMAEIANKVAVLYSYNNANGDTVQGVTDWAEDDWSQGRYGVFELRSSATDILPSAAETRRDLVLGDRSDPTRTIGSGGSATLTLICRGLWSLLGGEYYANADGYAGNDVDSDAQVAIGWQLTDNVIGFHQEYIWDMDARIHTLPNGTRLAVTGAVNSRNNQTFVIEGNVDPAAYSVTADTIFFDPADDVFDSGGGLDIFPVDALIEVSGSLSNDKYMFIAEVDDPDHFEIRGTTVALESAGATITISQGSGLKTDKQLKLELPNNSITMTAIGLKATTSFTVTGDWTIYEVEIEAAAIGGPSDNLLVEFYDDSSGDPGSLQATATLTNAEAPTGLTRVSLDLDSPMAVATGNTYHIVIERSGSYAPAAFWTIGVDEDVGYAGSFRLWDGSSWVSRSPNASLCFALWGHEETTTQIDAMLTSASVPSIAEIVWDSSNVLTREYREGERRIRAEIEDLLALGTSTNRRLLATVSPSRSILIHQAALPSYLDWVWTSDHRIITPHGTPADEGRLPAGRWLTDAVTGESMFVEAAEYDAGSGRVSIEIAEDRSPWDV